jgi:ribonuclease BN (tRNA processing enzyme)
MRVLITGVGDAFPRRRFSTSAVVEGPEGLVLIDCPDPIHRLLHEASQRSGWNVSASNIDDLIITHLHGDHSNGLETFGFWRRLERMKNAGARRPQLHVSEPVARRVWEKLAPAMDMPFGEARPSTLEDYFDVGMLEPGRVAQVAGLAVQCRFTQHPVPTIGLLLSDGRRTLGWSSDTPFDAEHIDWLSHADVIVHESNLGPSHTPIERLNALPNELKRRMRLVHLPEDFDAATTDIAILREGEVLEW